MKVSAPDPTSKPDGQGSHHNTLGGDGIPGASWPARPGDLKVPETSTKVLLHANVHEPPYTNINIHAQ